MDVAYINPFIKATAQLFATMINVPLKLGKPSLRRPADRLYKLYTISAAIRLSGSVSGQIVISFAQPVALTLCSALAGKRFERIDEDVSDALGEIANMIVNGAKPGLPNAKGVKITTPTVMNASAVMHGVNDVVIIIPFDTAAGRFIIETALHTTAPAQSAPDVKAA